MMGIRVSHRMVRILKLRLADALRCAALLLLAGCGGDDADQTPAAAGIEQMIDRGAFSVVIKLDNAKPSIADRLTLSLEVNAEEAYEVTFPSFDGDTLGEFGIVDRSSTLPELIDGARTRRTRTLTLEPFLSGDYVIAPMTFTFQKGSEAPLEVETEEIKIVVASLLPTAVEKLEIHEIEGPVTMAPPSRTAFWLMLCGIILVLAAAGGGFYWWSTKQSAKAAPIIIRPAHEIALDALQDLLADDLPGKRRDQRILLANLRHSSALHRESLRHPRAGSNHGRVPRRAARRTSSATRPPAAADGIFAPL